MIKHDAAFDVQLAIAKATKLRVDTRQLTRDEVQYQIGYKWTLVLNEDELKKLWNLTDSPMDFKSKLDEIKVCPERFKWNPYLASK